MEVREKGSRKRPRAETAPGVPSVRIPGRSKLGRCCRACECRENDPRLLFSTKTSSSGTFAPAFRASESPMAIACLRLVTFFPLRPLFSVPALLLMHGAFHLLARHRTVLSASRVFFLRTSSSLAFKPSPFCCMGSRRQRSEVVRGGGRMRGRQSRFSATSRCGGQNVFDVNPLRRILAGVAGHAEVDCPRRRRRHFVTHPVTNRRASRLQ